MKHFTFLFLSTLLLTSCTPGGRTPLENGDHEKPAEEEESSTEESTSEESEPTEVSLQVGLIALEDNGENGPLVGCGDSLVFVTQTVTGPLTAEEKIQAALEALLAIKEPTYGESGLYTALDEATVTVDSVKLTKDHLIVALSGTLSSGGTCDDPRIIQQIEETASSNAGVGSELEVTVLINGKSLEEQLNAKGE